MKDKISERIFEVDLTALGYLARKAELEYRGMIKDGIPPMYIGQLIGFAKGLSERMK